MRALKRFQSQCAGLIDEGPVTLVKYSSNMVSITSDRLVFELYRNNKLESLRSWIGQGLCTANQADLWKMHTETLFAKTPVNKRQPWVRREFRDVWFEVVTGKKTLIDQPFSLADLLKWGSRFSVQSVLKTWNQPSNDEPKPIRIASYMMLLECEHQNNPQAFAGKKLTLAQEFILHLAGVVQMDLNLLPESILAELLEADVGL